MKNLFDFNKAVFDLWCLEDLKKVYKLYNFNVTEIQEIIDLIEEKLKR